MTTYEWLSLIINTALVGVAFLAVRQININRKQFHLTTLDHCISDFRNIKGLNRLTEDEEVISRYVDLCNEELFYFQHQYVPAEVAIEWTEGMIDFLPVTNPKKEILNAAYCIQNLAQQRKTFFKDYPRIRHAFEVKDNYDMQVIYSDDEAMQRERIKERMRLIREILKNVADFDGYTNN